MSGLRLFNPSITIVKRTKQLRNLFLNWRKLILKKSTLVQIFNLFVSAILYSFSLHFYCQHIFSLKGRHFFKRGFFNWSQNFFFLSIVIINKSTLVQIFVFNLNTFFCRWFRLMERKLWPKTLSYVSRGTFYN